MASKYPSNILVSETNWSLCCICQEVKDDTIIDPSLNNTKGLFSGYQTLSTNLPEFHKINCLPMTLDIKRLDDGNGIFLTLQRHRAIYHKNKCFLKFANSKLEKAKQKQIDMCDTSKRKLKTDVSDLTAPKQPRVCFDRTQCLICEEALGNDVDVHELTSSTTKSKILEAATTVKDENLIKKMNSKTNDVIGIQYHLLCMVNLYNKERNILSAENSESNSHLYLDTDYKNKAMLELLQYISQRRNSSDTYVTFKLCELVH